MAVDCDRYSYLVHDGRLASFTIHVQKAVQNAEARQQYAVLLCLIETVTLCFVSTCA